MLAEGSGVLAEGNGVQLGLPLIRLGIGELSEVVTSTRKENK